MCLEIQFGSWEIDQQWTTTWTANLYSKAVHSFFLLTTIPMTYCGPPLDRLCLYYNIYSFHNKPPDVRNLRIITIMSFTDCHFRFSNECQLNWRSTTPLLSKAFIRFILNVFIIQRPSAPVPDTTSKKTITKYFLNVGKFPFFRLIITAMRPFSLPSQFSLFLSSSLYPSHSHYINPLILQKYLQHLLKIFWKKY